MQAIIFCLSAEASCFRVTQYHQICNLLRHIENVLAFHSKAIKLAALLGIDLLHLADSFPTSKMPRL